MNADLNRCLTRAELCDLLKISENTSRRMDRDGSGPRPVRLSPRVVRYPIAEVAQFMRVSGMSAPAELRPGFDLPTGL